MRIEALADKVKQGNQVTRQEALWLYEQPLEELCQKADEIRKHFCADKFDICTIINAKSGHCPEDCRFCAQSAHNNADVQKYELLTPEEIVEDAEKNAQQGVLRYSIVTSGKKLCDREVDQICEAVRGILKKTNLRVCVSSGLLNAEQYEKLKKAGVSRIHNNLETSRTFFTRICTTHSYDEKIEAIRAAQEAGLKVCSGGIMGLGETPEDRVDMALTLRDMGVQSVPVNMLNAIAGTPLEGCSRLTQDDMRRIVAVYRFILPTASIRLAGGRGLLEDKGDSCFMSGANAAISGDMLTTAGITVEKDMERLARLGYTPGYDFE